MLSDIIADLLGGLLGDEVGERRQEKKRRKSRLKIADSGFEAIIPCVLRWPNGGYPRWRHGSLKLRNKTAEWQRRSSQDTVVVLNPGAMSGEFARKVAFWEAFKISSNLKVLAYSIGGARLELAVATEDLSAVARVLEIPANRLS